MPCARRTMSAAPEGRQRASDVSREELLARMDRKELPTVMKDVLEPKERLKMRGKPMDRSQVLQVIPERQLFAYYMEDSAKLATQVLSSSTVKEHGR